jgi:hypothetical protein
MHILKVLFAMFFIPLAMPVAIGKHYIPSKVILQIAISCIKWPDTVGQPGYPFKAGQVGIGQVR